MRLVHVLRYEREFQKRWDTLINEFSQDGPDAFWLIRHANYLFRTGGVRWGLDLTVRTRNMRMVTEPRVSNDLANLDFVLVSHFHADHFNPHFCAQMAGDKALWIAPASATAEQRACLQRSHEHVCFVKAGDVLHLKNNICITVLPGHHFDLTGMLGVDAAAYLVECNGRRMLFPGDVRDYLRGYTPEVQGADCLFSHVWLGRSQAKGEPNEEYLQGYCRYLESFKAKRVFLTHLYDLSRTEDEMWTETHAEAVRSRLPEQNITIPIIGEMQKL